jgi:hypothetical protein
MQRQSDIEVYIRGSDIAAIEAWLGTAFFAVALNKPLQPSIAGVARVNDGGPACDLLLVKNAVKGFTCIWFKQNHTPWDNDLACARSAFAHLQVEIRASAGDWSEGDADDLFVRINAEGESPIVWTQ